MSAIVGMCFFGIMRRCVFAYGWISGKIMQVSSSYRISAGISLAIILQKMQSDIRNYN